MIEPYHFAFPSQTGRPFAYRVEVVRWSHATIPPPTPALNRLILERRDWCVVNLGASAWTDRSFRDAFPIDNTVRRWYFLFKHHKDAVHFLLRWGHSCTSNA